MFKPRRTEQHKLSKKTKQKQKRRAVRLDYVNAVIKSNVKIADMLE